MNPTIFVCLVIGAPLAFIALCVYAEHRDYRKRVANAWREFVARNKER